MQLFRNLCLTMICLIAFTLPSFALEIAYKGLLDDQHEVFVLLQISDRDAKISGSYFLSADKIEKNLKGEFKNNRKSLVLKEFLANKNTGSFSGDLSAVLDSIEGEWVDVKGETKSFYLWKVSAAHYEAAKQAKSSKDISDANFKLFVEGFIPANYPLLLNLSEEEDYQVFEPQELALTPQIQIAGSDMVYKQKVIFDKQYILLFVAHYYSHGAMGIRNYYTHVYTFDYKGNAIDHAELGCYCTDTNTEENNYHFTNAFLNLDFHSIKMNILTVFATLSETGTNSDFHQESRKKLRYEISPEGKLNLKSE